MEKKIQVKGKEISISYVPIDKIIKATYNPRKWNEVQLNNLMDGIRRFGIVDPLILNSASGRENVLIGGHMRLAALIKLGYTEIPAVYVNIPEIEREKELNLRLYKNTGEFDYDLLEEFDPKLLEYVGFNSEDLDDIFLDDDPEMWNLEDELKKLDINKIEIKNGDIYEFADGSRLMNGDSMVEADMLKLMDGEKADMCLTDPPYLLQYLKGKTKNKDGVTRGFGAKKNRVYLGAQTLPDNFTELWMANIAKIQKKDFSIIIFENPKNLKTIWTAMEKFWKYRNTITWHIPNRMQGFSSKYRFFNKTDIALVGTQGNVALNLEPESEELFQQEYE